MNLIARLEFEIAYCDVTDQHVNHFATGTHPFKFNRNEFVSGVCFEMYANSFFFFGGGLPFLNKIQVNSTTYRMCAAYVSCEREKKGKKKRENKGQPKGIIPVTSYFSCCCSCYWFPSTSLSPEIAFGSRKSSKLHIEFLDARVRT